MENGNWIHSTAIIEENVKMGSGNVIYPHAVIGEMGFIRGKHPVTFPSKVVVIGNNNVIGCHASIMAGVEDDTVIGNNNLIMNYVNIGHDVCIGDFNEIGVHTTICGFVIIEDKNQIKVGVQIRNRLTVGSNNIIGMGANVVAPVSDNEKIMGNPAK